MTVHRNIAITAKEVIETKGQSTNWLKKKLRINFLNKVYYKSTHFIIYY